MIRDPISTTYARALLEIGQSQGQSVEYEEELQALAALLSEDKSFRVFLESPKIPRPEKKAVLEKSLKGRVSDSVLDFLLVLVDRNRQSLLGEIAESFTDLNDEARGRVHVNIASAKPVSEESWQELVGALKRRLDKELIMEHKVDEDLLGGLTIQVGDTVVDGSIRTELVRVREALVSQRLGSDLFDED